MGTLTLGNGVSIRGWSLFHSDLALRNLPLVYKNTLAACNDTSLLRKGPKGIILCNKGSIIKQMETLILSYKPGAILVHSDPMRLDIRYIKDNIGVSLNVSYASPCI